MKSAYPNHLRLSIHQSTGEHKISLSLLNTKTAFTTPWHCCVAETLDGEWISGPKGDFEHQADLEIVHENGRPSFFRQRTANASSNQVKDLIPEVQEIGQSSPETLTESNPPSQNSIIRNRSSMAIDGPMAVTGSTTTSLSASITDIQHEKKEHINPFLGSDHSIVDPKSEKFRPRAWLQALMNVVNDDPERYPRRVAGVAYSDLSVHAFGSPTDYQRTFLNSALSVVDLTRRLLGMQRKLKINILQGFEGLVKQGEMLVVLGRPGRQENPRICRQIHADERQWLLDVPQDHFRRN